MFMKYDIATFVDPCQFWLKSGYINGTLQEELGLFLGVSGDWLPR
jgi:hypothetical protein